MNKKQAQKVAALLNDLQDVHSIRIGAYDYALVLEKDWQIIEGKKVWGSLDPTEHIITLANVARVPSPNFLVGVMIHETLHAIWTQTTLPAKAKEEEVVTALEVGLLGMLRDNLWLLDWIKKGLS